MKCIIHYFVYTFVLLKTVYCANNCDKNGILLYQDIGCTPVQSESDPCVTSYDCSFPESKNGCLFKGRSYGKQEEIDSSITYSGCQIACRCSEANHIICAVLDCPEFFQSGQSDPTCYLTYTLEKCCSTGKRCNTTNNEKICNVDGTIYKIGQRFYPKNSCLKCVCHQEFAGEFDDKTCAKHNCNTELRFSEELRKSCAPVYVDFGSDGDAVCCPDDFICPETTDVIEIVSQNVEASDLRCSFGDKKMKVGEGLKRQVNVYGRDWEILCQCVVPPLLMCKQVMKNVGKV